MNLFYKILLAVLIICLGLNIYAIDWQLGFSHEENSKFIFSAAASVAGIFLIFVLNLWGKLAGNKR